MVGQSVNVGLPASDAGSRLRLCNTTIPARGAGLRPGPTGFEPGEAFARSLDDSDPLAGFRDRFELPGPAGERVYLLGNSLGPLPRTTRGRGAGGARRMGGARRRELLRGRPALVRRGHPLPRARWPAIVGARPREVALTGTLTTNLHLLFASFFRPDGGRTRILMERPGVSLGPVRRRDAARLARHRSGRGPARGRARPARSGAGSRHRSGTGRTRGRSGDRVRGRRQLRDRRSARPRPHHQGGARGGGAGGLRPGPRGGQRAARPCTRPTSTSRRGAPTST